VSITIVGIVQAIRRFSLWGFGELLSGFADDLLELYFRGYAGLGHDLPQGRGGFRRSAEIHAAMYTFGDSQRRPVILVLVVPCVNLGAMGIVAKLDFEPTNNRPMLSKDV
jgi:hypothetical protein